MNTQPPSCQSNTPDPGLLSVDDARSRIQSAIRPVACIETVAIRDGLGRVIAESVISPLDVPPHTNSAMDGYAVRSSDLADKDDCLLKVIGTAWAGKPFDGAVKNGEAVRIMTGAVVPDDTDTVVIQENVVREGDTIRPGTGNRQGQNVRKAGEDLRKGQTVLAPGKLIMPAELGLLASLGITEIRVMRRIRVAFFSTGDELRPVGTDQKAGQIFDCNRYTLFGMLTRMGIDLVDMGIVPDRREEIETAFRDASASADAIITTGGVSVGEADYVKDILEKLGTTDFWKVAMKPGRPLAFGHVGSACFFGLPGNPVSVMVTFYEFVKPALQKMAGIQETGTPVVLKVPCTTSLKKRGERMEFQRGILENDTNGELTVKTTGEQGSGILNSMSMANCFIILSPEMNSVEAGTLVEVQPFSTLV